jgi:hypothetical protein
MAKSTKASKTKAPSPMKKLSRTQRTLNTGELKKVRGGDFDGDSDVDGMDWLKKKKPVGLGK